MSAWKISGGCIGVSATCAIPTKRYPNQVSRGNSSRFSRFRSTALIATLLATIIVPFVSGCNPDVPEELQQMWPIWKAEDLEINKRSGNTVLYDHELNLRPKYYRGSMPVIYTSRQPLSGAMSGMGGPSFFYAFEFGEFSNYFIYDGILLKGIVAVDESNKLAAEARFEWRTDDNSGLYRPKMEEFHYAGGKLIFHCESQIDYDSGTKISESQQSGTKQKDYFFILPFGINAR